MFESGKGLDCPAVEPDSIEGLRQLIATESTHCNELLEFYRSRNTSDLTNMDIFAELCWVVYSSGFRYSVVQRYWKSLANAYFSFRVEKVAQLAKNLQSNARRICELSTFHNVRKAQWCILNAQRVVELDRQLTYEGGLRGFVVELSKKSQYELVEQIPDLIAAFQFKGIGSTTMFHLLKNLGVDIFKPDRHLRRILFAWGLTDGFDASTSQICSAMEYLAAMTGARVNELDTILFHYGQRTNQLRT